MPVSVNGAGGGSEPRHHQNQATHSIHACLSRALRSTHLTTFHPLPFFTTQTSRRPPARPEACRQAGQGEAAWRPTIIIVQPLASSLATSTQHPPHPRKASHGQRSIVVARGQGGGRQDGGGGSSFFFCFLFDVFPAIAVRRAARATSGQDIIWRLSIQGTLE